ncbi:MAG: hypothetical protein HY516_02395 [Candidatus Aenigmarchaeota archaeon]|nr:hypothetical protein [Candidatus Aenigmarchaeota archaeon]
MAKEAHGAVFDATDPLGSALSNMAHANLDSLRTLNLTEQRPEYHESGWHLSVVSGNSLVGLWHSWLGNEFYLGYPKSVEVADETIMRTLGVTHARPVRYVSATAFPDAKSADAHRDADKPTAPYKFGGVLAYREEYPRQFGRFYGPQLPDGRGRVWVDVTASHSHEFEFPLIDEKGEPKPAQHGYHLSSSIFTVTYAHCNQYAPECPSTDAKAFAPYKSRFIALAAEIAFMAGKPDRIAVKVAQPKSTPFVPERLEKEGYSEIEWLKGRPGVRIGYGDDVVRAKKGNEVILVESANGLVPWTVTRQVQLPRTAMRKGDLYELIDGLFFF